MERQGLPDLICRRHDRSAIDSHQAQRPIGVPHGQVRGHRESLGEPGEGQFRDPSEHRPNFDRAAQPEEVDTEAVRAALRSIHELVALQRCEQPVDGGAAHREAARQLCQSELAVTFEERVQGCHGLSDDPHVGTLGIVLGRSKTRRNRTSRWDGHLGRSLHHGTCFHDVETIRRGGSSLESETWRSL